MSKSFSKIIPAISLNAIQQVQDPQARAVLQSIADGLAVRNGDKGDGENAFLTVADFKKEGYIAEAVANLLAEKIGNGVKNPGTAMFDLAAALEQRILASPEWLSLFARISLIDAPDTSPGSLAYNLLLEAKTRGAAITSVNSVIQNKTESLAQRVDLVTAAIGANAAAIKEETYARANADSAEAGRLTSFIAQTGQNFSGMYSDSIVKTNNDNALASAVNLLWAKVGNNSALISSGGQLVVNQTGSALTKWDQLQATITDPVTGLVVKAAALRNEYNLTNSIVNGMAGNWSLKLDLNGYVSGLSLNASVDTAGKTRSSFYVLADVFAVGAPGRQGIVPFAIDSQTGLVAIRGDLVTRGSITGQHIGAYAVDRSKLAFKAVGGAQIDDLAVDTLKIGNNAVTVPVYLSGGYVPNFWSGVSRTVGQITVFYPADVDIVAIVSWKALAPGTGGNTGVGLTVDGWEFHYTSDSNINSFALSHSTTAKVRLGPGNHTFQIRFDNNWHQGGWDLNGWSLTLLGVMK